MPLADPFFDSLRTLEFSRLDEQNQTYLDFTGGNLYPISVLNKHFDMLKNAVLGNPHSTNPSSLLATKWCEEAREKISSFFNASDYYCVFTANASASLQIIGECFPFGPDSHFLLFADNHNSVNGIREYCKNKGGTFTYSQLNVENLRINEAQLTENLTAHPNKTNKLFAFPAQSNVSGVKHDLNWVKVAQENGWTVLLDAAAFVPTSPLNLSEVQADFVSVSFYKMFGYPTGLGCLFIKKSSFHLLQKPWFAGGTVSFASVTEPTFYLHQNHEKFENGTINYLGIPALKLGLEFLEEIGIQRINQRISKLTAYLITELDTLTHENGKKLIHIFGPKDLNYRGGNVIFNVEDTEGKHYPFEEIELEANKKLISLRTGCFCNPGIDEINHCVSHDDLLIFYTSLSDQDVLSIVKELKRIRGAIRVSVGIPTNQKDIDKLIDFLKQFLNKRIA